MILVVDLLYNFTTRLVKSSNSPIFKSSKGKTRFILKLKSIFSCVKIKINKTAKSNTSDSLGSLKNYSVINKNISVLQYKL